MASVTIQSTVSMLYLLDKGVVIQYQPGQKEDSGGSEIL